MLLSRPLGRRGAVDLTSRTGGTLSPSPVGVSRRAAGSGKMRARVEREASVEGTATAAPEATTPRLPVERDRTALPKTPRGPRSAR